MANQRRMTRAQKRRAERDMDHMVNILNQKFAMRKINPIIKTQEYLFDDYKQGFNIAAIGTAGTGKTMCGLYLALKDVLENNEYKRVVVIRSAVQTREQGFMPGSKQEKEAVYETPYMDIVNDLFGRGDAYQILKQKKMLEFMSSSFVRGLTFDNAIIIVDECQNMRYDEIRSIITRVGESSRIIFCGDTMQDDLAGSRNRLDVSGLRKFLDVIEKMSSFSTIKFTVDDVVRSGVVKEFIITEEALAAA